MKNSLGGYKIGLIIIGVFTLVLVGVVVLQAGATKQDAATTKRAQAAADKLNSFTTAHQTAPQSLQTAGVTDSSGLSYTRLSDTKYRFCEAYKASSSGFDPSEVETSIATANLPSATSDFGGSSESDYLDIPSTHHKGSNCQTITLDTFDSLLNSTIKPTPQTSTGDLYCGQPHPGGATDDATVSAVSSSSITVEAAKSTAYPLASNVKVFNASCQPVDVSQILEGDTVRLVFDKPNSTTVAAVIDSSF